MADPNSRRSKDFLARKALSLPLPVNESGEPTGLDFWSTTRELRFTP